MTVHSTPKPAQQTKHRAKRPRRGLFTLGILTLLLSVIALVVLLQTVNRPPRLIGPYLERRASGHNPLIEQTGVTLNWILQKIDRGTIEPRLEFPPWALHPKFQSLASDKLTERVILVKDANSLRLALEKADPGDVITLLPGSYDFEGSSLNIVRSGIADMPIIVRPKLPGTATLNFRLTEGFHVQAPYWRFEQLNIVGRCKVHSDCEHAFHIVGNARHTVIRGNDIQNFNAHIKINGANGKFPDDGRIEGNRLINTTSRLTDNPVTLIDLVGASNWIIDQNLIADFVKEGGDQVSYGAFAKGGGRNNTFLRNIVLCEHRLRGTSGQRVGLSLGGGGTSPTSCRDKRCVVEQEQSEIRNNLIASCADDGIYINRSPQSAVTGNTLIDTAGISIRFPESSAVVVGNWLDGPIAVRDGARIELDDNRSPSVTAIFLGLEHLRSDFANKPQLDLRWITRPSQRSSASNLPDLCGTARSTNPMIGAFENINDCLPRSTN